jgi:hypothetical protein
VSGKGIQKSPFAFDVGQEGFGALGQVKEAAARIASPRPDSGRPGVRFVDVDAGLGVDVDVQASEGEAG